MEVKNKKNEAMINVTHPEAKKTTALFQIWNKNTFMILNWNYPFKSIYAFTHIPAFSAAYTQLKPDTY